MTVPEDRIRRLLTESLDAELGPRLDGPSDRAALADRLPETPSRRTARWALPLAAAAAVVGIVVGVVVADGGSGSTPTPSGSGAAVTCAVTGSGSIDRDRSTLLARARALGDGTPSVTSGGGSVVVEVPGATRRAVSSVCSSTTLEFRPVIAPAQVVQHGTTFRYPLAHLSFTAPRTGSGYDRLTSAQRQKLVRRLRHAACAPTRFGATGPVVACDHGENGEPLAYLLGPTVLDGSAVRSATPQAPGSRIAGPNASWSVNLTFDRDGAQAWSAFTGRHHSNDGDAATATVTTCSTARVPCEDFVAFVTDGRALAVPLTSARLSAQTQITGSYTHKTARRLADELGAGRLPVPLHLVGTRALP